MKKWYKSKVIWWNIITIVLGIVEVYNKSYPIPAEVLSFVNGIGNMVLRFLTTKGIGSEK